MGIFINS